VAQAAGASAVSLSAGWLQPRGLACACSPAPSPVPGFSRSAVIPQHGSAQLRAAPGWSLREGFISCVSSAAARLCVSAPLSLPASLPVSSCPPRTRGHPPFSPPCRGHSAPRSPFPGILPSPRCAGVTRPPAPRFLHALPRSAHPFPRQREPHCSVPCAGSPFLQPLPGKPRVTRAFTARENGGGANLTFPAPAASRELGLVMRLVLAGNEGRAVPPHLPP